MTRVPISSMPMMKTATLASVHPSDRSTAERLSTVASPFSITARAGSRTSVRTMTRSSTINQPTLLQGAQDHHGRGDRERQSEHQAGTDRPAERPGERHTERRHQDDLDEGARDRDGADREKVLQREMQPDAEHQEDDAELRELVGELDVADKTRGERPYHHAGEQISD